MRTATVILLGGLLALLLAAPARGQTTGTIVGAVQDAQDRAVPGVTVTATSPQLPGTRTAVTDATGRYQIPTVPPGTYTVRAELGGFQPAERENVTVGLGQTASVNLTLQVAGVEATVTVGAAAPTIDVTSPSGGFTATEELFEQLPIRRDFYAVSRLAPGLTQDVCIESDPSCEDLGAAALGSTGAENQYIIEGLNMTGMILGEKQKTVNFDFIQEVNVKTQGLNAEYGRMTGTVIEAITKSGGNSFHGGLFTYATGGPLTADNDTAGKLPNTSTQIIDVAHEWDAGFDVGGYLVPDKLWFFGAYDGINERRERTVIRDIPNAAPGTPGPGSVEPLSITRHTFAGKLTYNLGNNQTLVGSINGDPRKQDGAIFTVQGTPGTYTGTLEQGGVDGIVRYNGVFRNTWLVEAFYGRHNEHNTYGGLGTTMPLFLDFTTSPNPLSGGFGFYQDSDLSRDQIRGVVTKFWSGHTFKVGMDYERNDALVQSHQGGAGQRIYQFQTGGVTYYRHRYYVDDTAAGFDRDNPDTWVIANPLVSEPITHNTAFFAQDSWRVTSNASIDVGIRWERQDIFGRDRSTAAIALSDNWAGRFGFVIDPTRDGRSKIFGHYGRYYESIPMDINIRAFGGELTCFCYNFSPDADEIVPAADTPRRTSLLGGPEPVDSPLKGQYIDEVLVGVEREVAPQLVVAARVNYRTLGRVIEDFLTPDGTYFIANPGEGTLGQQLTFYDYTTAPAPKVERTNTAVELSMRKRFSNNWQAFGSYVWSRLDGNYDGTFQASTGQLDPNINSAFDFGDFLINADGPLSNDRRHQFKLDGSYRWSEGPAQGLTLGLSTHYLSGTPLTAFGYSFVYQNWEYYLTPRGALGRNPGIWEADLHLGYPLQLGNNRSLNLSMDIFNLFNRQATTLLDQRYNLSSDPPCGGIPEAICNGDNGLLHQENSLQPVAQLSNPRATALNPDFLTAGRAFTAPLSVRFGARLEF